MQAHYKPNRRGPNCFKTILLEYNGHRRLACLMADTKFVLRIHRIHTFEATGFSIMARTF